jgi:hypothetical protein
MSYIRYLCLFACSGVVLCFCFVCLRLVFLLCLSSSCVPFVAGFSGLPLRYSVTFIRCFLWCVLHFPDNNAEFTKSINHLERH